jgi:hypothetical protein
MAKGSRSRSRKQSRKQRGGSWTSGSTYGEFVNGPGPAQFDRTFSATGPYADRIGTGYIGAQGQWFREAGVPTAQNLELVQSAGRRRKGKRGGFLGPVISQAIVPATILGLQQSYGRRGSSFNKTRRNRRFSRRR